MSLVFYIAGVAGQMTQHRLDVISHNMANVNTTGYLAGGSTFATFLAGKPGSHMRTPPAYSTFNGKFLDMRKGPIHATGNDLDLAIQGQAFFRVSLPDGTEGYTRAGDFQLGADGSLRTRGGHPVLDDGGHSITLPRGHIAVSTEGEISVNGTPVARLGLLRILDASKVERIGEAILKTPVSNTAPATPDVNIRQRALEGSNVNAVLAMAEMIDTMRSYQSSMKIIEQFNRQSALLVDRVGRLQA